VLKPVAKQIHQWMRVDPAILDKFAEFLQQPGHLQRTAFGRQVKEIMNGWDSVELDNVSTCKKITKLTFNYMMAIMTKLDVTAKDGSALAPD
jgi:hypothetical protein